MKANHKLKLLSLLLIFGFNIVAAQNQKPVALWKFDTLEKTERVTPGIYREKDAPDIERISNVSDEISGAKSRIFGNFFKLVKGIEGNALLLDGISSFMSCDGGSAPELTGDFSVGAWIALGAYPTNWCPVIDHGTAIGKGYFLGIDAYGHAGFKIFTAGKYYEIQSEERLALKKWRHLQGIYSKANGIELYVDGKLVASQKTEGNFQNATGSLLLIGRHSIKRKPDGTIRPNATEAVYTFFDGLIDEVMVHNRSLTSKELTAFVNKSDKQASPAMMARSLPVLSAPFSRFGAYYTTLKYYDAWDALWRNGEEADVVVKFDNLPGKFVFWRGTSYIPNWVTENGIWYNNEFTETWSVLGCHEPMSDKRCQFSHVRILENSDARVVVHWRYALVDNWANIARIDTLTGWGEWTDEIYTIYPDGVAVREITLRSSKPQTPHEFQESILVMGPGQRPEDVLQPAAITLGNLKGETYSYSWEKGIPPEADKERRGVVSLPFGANIQMVNTKSELKPFVIVSPESKPIWDIYNGELRRDVSMFPWWNHWPTAQKPTDGRYAMDSDQASHSSLSHVTWDAYSQTESSKTKLMLNGLSNKKPEQLVPLAKSWLSPAELKIDGSSGYKNLGFDQTERAYKISSSSRDSHDVLKLVLEATSESPVINPCLVITNWGTENADLSIENKPIERGNGFRYGFRNTPEGTDLVIWIEKESVTPVNITLRPSDK